MPADIPALITALRSDDPVQQAAAAEKLAQSGTDAQPAAVALVEACAGDDDVHEWAVSALEGMGPPPVADVSRLAQLLSSPYLDVAYWAATLLGRLAAQAAPAVVGLATAAYSHAELAVRQRAVWALGQIGPSAAPTLAILRKASQSSDHRLAALAREAIEQIGR